MKTARKPRPCVVCGTEFVPLGQAHKICSAECRSQEARDRSTAWHVTNGTMSYREPAPPSLCDVCGREYKRRGNTKTCSWACHALRKARRAAERLQRIHDTQGAELRAMVAFKRGETVAPIEIETVYRGFACLDCAHWRPLADSETGGMCAIERFRACNPYSVTPKFYRGAPHDD